MTRLFCMALLLFGLGGCGETGNGAAIPTLIVRNISCGEIVLSGNPARAADHNVVGQAARCLAQAFQTCTATTLTIRDTTNNLTRQFSVLRNGAACTLRQALQTDPNSPPAIADCEQARADHGALVVRGCSHLGDFTLTP